MSDFTAMLEQMTISGATSDVVAAATSKPQDLSALIAQLNDRYRIFFKTKKSYVIYIPKVVMNVSSPVLLSQPRRTSRRSSQPSTLT